MNGTGIFFGSSTGNCEIIAHMIRRHLGIPESNVHDVFDTPVDSINMYSNLIFGISTWGVGGMQEDWERFIEELNSIDLNNKTLALYGLGDQDTYTDSFADALGELYDFMSTKNCKIIGSWPSDSYNFDQSRALKNGTFVGLVIDEEVQSNLTNERVQKWCSLIKAKLV